MFQILKYTDDSRRLISYFGLKLFVPNQTNYIASDANGKLFAFSGDKPTYNEEIGIWVHAIYDSYLYIGICNIKGNAADSLLDISKIPHKI